MLLARGDRREMVEKNGGKSGARTAQSTIQNCTGAIKNAGFGGNGGLGGGYTARRNFMIELGAPACSQCVRPFAHPAGMVYILTVRHGAWSFADISRTFPLPRTDATEAYASEGCPYGCCCASSVWKGFIRFGLVTLPVRAYTATGGAGTSIALNQIHKGCGARIKYKKTCPDHGEVTAGEIVSGYQHSPGQYVIIEGSELDKLRSEKDKAVNIVAFIKPDAIDPSQYSGAHAPISSPMARLATSRTHYCCGP